MDDRLDDDGLPLPEGVTRHLLIIQNLAPILLSSVLATFILGLACAQAYAYACSARYRSDHLVLRASVAIVILINIAALAVTWAALWTRVIDEGGLIAPLATLSRLQYVGQPTLTCIVQVVAQSFFWWRCNSFLRVSPLSYRTFGRQCRFTLLGVSGLLICTNACGFAIAGITLTVPREEIVPWFPTILRLIDGHLFGAAACDTILAAVLCAEVLTYRSRLPRASGVGLVNRILRITLGTGLLTALCAIAGGIVSHLTGLETNDSLIFTTSLPALYASSMLIALAVRDDAYRPPGDDRCPSCAHKADDGETSATLEDGRELDVVTLLLSQRPTFARAASSVDSVKGIPPPPALPHIEDEAGEPPRVRRTRTVEFV